MPGPVLPTVSLPGCGKPLIAEDPELPPLLPGPRKASPAALAALTSSTAAVTMTRRRWSMMRDISASLR
jgi:hypothetical protein